MNKHNKKIDNEILKILYDDGCLDDEIASAFGVDISCICRARKKLNLQTKYKHSTYVKYLNDYKKQCTLCKKIFHTNISQRKHCYECSHDLKIKYFLIRAIRSSYSKMKMVNPELAEAYKKDLEVD